MKTVIWKLKAENLKIGQEEADQKLQEGMNYVKRLEEGGEKISKVINKRSHLEILIEE